MRCFVAIPVPDDIGAGIRRFAAECAKLQKKDIRYVEDAHFHITMKFLGDLDESAVKALDGLLKGIRQGPFDVGIKGAGAFPNLVFPKVLWVGVSGGAEMEALAAQTEEAAFAAGVGRDDRPFSPHITVGRVKGTADAKLAGFFKTSAGRDFGGFSAGEMALFKSELTPKGPVYARLETYRLGR